MMRFPEKIPDWVLTVGIPTGFLILTFVVEQGFNIRCFTSCEDGPVETAQALVAFMAFLIAVKILRMERGAYPGWVRAWFALGAVACIYIALEEISYGQRIFGWVTPDSWGLVNDQDETNLHNASSWLDQKPRALLELGVIIGGLVIPALRRWKPKWLPRQFALVYPASALFVTALIAELLRVYETATEMAGRQDLFFIVRGSEFQESYFMWFILLYFLLKSRELKN